MANRIFCIASAFSTAPVTAARIPCADEIPNDAESRALRTTGALRCGIAAARSCVCRVAIRVRVLRFLFSRRSCHCCCSVMSLELHGFFHLFCRGVQQWWHQTTVNRGAGEKHLCATNCCDIPTTVAQGMRCEKFSGVPWDKNWKRQN